ncbi:stage II sporulation protein D [Gorillibacterium sp. sgz5001074]|uniref:stage II sporulation protein D n=1 Tax=Gorillibacterium sp. sgz5001074 TaxID=3446695 RepID=UPI003F67E4AE
MNLTNRMRQQVTRWMAASLGAAFLFTLIFALLFRGGRSGDDLTPAVPPSAAASASMVQLIEQSSPAVPVFLSKQQRIEEVPIEAYVRGVVAAEMPIDFELEALKAQAIAARTYIVRRMKEQDSSQVPVKGAIVTDTVSHQAYISGDVLSTKWSGKDAAANMEKLNRAVAETKGEILLYGGKPIDAVFFSTSNGYTENAEDYWGKPQPYLKSVPSPWDEKLSPKFKTVVKVPYRTFLSKLGLNGSVAASTAVSGSKVLKQTDGHRVGQIRIGGKLFTGREVREKLELPSSQFEWRLKGSEVEITAYGYGHGVGMSQWGANGMAKEGKSAEDIVRYYYTGVQIGRADGSGSGA